MFCRILLTLLVLFALCGGELTVKWYFPFDGVYADRMLFGSSPAVADLGVNSVGGEPDNCLEIVVGSDEVDSPYEPYYGVWRCIDATGSLEWYLLTLTDEARSSPAIDDFWGDDGLGDSIPDIVGGTTSGWSVEAFSHDGHFLWRFGEVTGSGAYLWHSSPAVADIDPFVPGKEIVIGNSNADCAAVFCLEGDISDSTDDGYTGYNWATHSCWDTYIGADGTDWDVLWFFNTVGPIVSTPALANVDADGVIEVIVGTGWIDVMPSGASPGPGGEILCLNGVTGDVEWSILTGGAQPQVPGSPAVADVDGDGDNEIFIGAADGYLYCIDGDENHSGAIDPWEISTVLLGGVIYSSPAVGDVDGDGNYEVVLGDGEGYLDCIRYFPRGDSVHILWRRRISSQPIFSSPALCAPGDSIPWAMFRQNPRRTGFYPPTGDSGFIFIGTREGYLFCVDGAGTVVDSLKLGESIVTSPAIADIDRDCFLEVLIVSATMESGNGPDTLWCLGTDIPSGLAECDTCGEITVSAECPVPCFGRSSCRGQVVEFSIEFDTWDPPDTSHTFFTAVIFHPDGSADTLGFDGDSSFVSFEPVGPGAVRCVVSFPESLLSDGDSVVVTLDSLRSQNGCITVP